MHEAQIERLLDNVNLSDEERTRLRRYYQEQEKRTSMSIVVATHHKRIRELEQLIRSPDRNVRRQAEYQLQITLDQINLDIAAAKDDAENNVVSSSGSEDEPVAISTTESTVTDPVSRHSSLEAAEDQDPEDQPSQFIDPDLEWDNERPLDSPEPEPEPKEQEINIRTPNVSINIRPSTGSTPRRPLASTPVTRQPTHSGMCLVCRIPNN